LHKNKFYSDDQRQVKHFEEAVEEGNSKFVAVQYMEGYGEVEEWLHLLLTSAIDVG